jgi:flagellar biosynthesis/type III secretory pathway protein FliH
MNTNHIDMVRAYALEMPIEEAVEQAITECINEDILAEFLKRNRAEAIEMSIFEYNEELHLANLRREGYEEGMQQGIQKGIQQGKALDIIELLSELGEVPDTLRNMIESSTDTETLKKWLKLAAKCTTIKEFEDSM